MEVAPARDHFIQAVSRIANFWGFPKAMGAIYGVVYLSPTLLSLDEIVELVGVSKGAVSTNIRHLERLGVVHKKIRIGDRRDFYVAETDFWKIIKGILAEREKSEFDLAIRGVTESLALLPQSDETTDEEVLFYRQRMEALQQCFANLDKLVATVITLDELRAGGFNNFFTKKNKNGGDS